MRKGISLIAAALVAPTLATEVVQARPVPLSTAFTYQGQLKQGGVNVNATADLQFTLWNAVGGPAQVAGPVAVNNVAIANGLFTAPIDFGAPVFNGEARWLEIAVRSPAGAGSFITLAPRQPLTAAPYALETRGVFVDNAGNVSIGTTAPNKKLTVAGSMEIGIHSADYQHLRIGGGNSSGFLYGSFPLYGDGIHMGYNYYANAAGAHQIINPGGGMSRIGMGYDSITLGTSPAGFGLPQTGYIMSGATFPKNRFFGGVVVNSNLCVDVGSIGIETTTPSFKLHLTSNSAAKPTSNTWTISSDARLKKDIQPIEHALDSLLALRGVTYRWIDPASQGGMDGTYTGMIAQEVEQVFPEWITEDKNGYKHLTVIGFEGLAIEALRDLRREKDDQLAAQQSQIENLQTENSELRRRLEALEQMMRRLLERGVKR